MINAAAAWRNDSWQEAKVALVSRLLTLGCIPAALEAISSNWSNEPPPQILAALVPHVKTFGGEALFPRALRAARLCATSGERAAILSTLALDASGPDKLAVCNELLSEVCASVADDTLQKGFALKADHISIVSRSSLYTAWLAVLGQKPRFREKTLTLLGSFWPAAEALGGDQVTKDSARALKGAVSWWP